MVDENTMIVGLEDIEDDNFPIGTGKKYVRASSGCFWKYEKLPEMNGILQTREEDAGGAEASAQFEALFEERKGWEWSSRSFGLADNKVQANAVGGKGWGSTSVNVRAEMEEVRRRREERIAAFLWDFGSRANMEISGDVERTLEEDEEGAGGFKKIVKQRQQMLSSHGDRHRDRTFASEMALQRADKNTIIILVAPIAGGHERATVVARGSVIVGNASAIEIADILIYFQRLVSLKEYGVEDGVALAQDLLWMASSVKMRVERLAEVLKANRAMRQLTKTLPWFEAMMAFAI
ncbi:hypothetical protein TrLO_g11948 [Triparma laevis f. longispina]|uniref:Uncharacterized protein n=1 Tax=Triparma laevis f. longispina TaxID=1714387 RepID=A0A9W7FQG1_9STRA|nr:hypothetical protein TrLO_g11948 [Triparma laevis f. longispina]